MKYYLILLLGILLLNSELIAQSENNDLDSLNTVIQVGVLTSQDIIPHYLQARQYGEIDSNDKVFVGGELMYKTLLGTKLDITTGFSFRNDLISSHYLRFGYNELFLSVGREKGLVGGLVSNLSSGSLAVSDNARPIPMISAGFSDYVNVPFTSGYFKAKGHLSHGWLEDDRFISNALLHSKSFYLKLDLEEEIGWTAASGIVHFAQYGGTSPQGDKQPSSFSDFLRVFAGSGIPNPDGTTEGESNGLGNHLGIIETTVTQKIGEHLLTVNYQKPFEDLGGLQYVSLTDYLFGLEWSLPDKKSLVNTVYLEYIQTKWQGGPGLPDATPVVPGEVENFGYSFGGRDDMYNNWLYRSGWTYQGRVIGSPLFLTHARAQEFLSLFPDYNVSIANNRIRAVHLGVRGWINPKFEFEGLFTYTQNFGTYSGLYEGRFEWRGIITDPNFEYVFRPKRKQFYSQLSLQYHDFFKDLPISLKLRLAYDSGDLYRTIGSELSILYDLTK